MGYNVNGQQNNLIIYNRNTFANNKFNKMFMFNLKKFHETTFSYK